MKAGFENKARLEHLGGKHFVLLRDLHFWSAVHNRRFTAPKGMETDLASIPWWAQSFVQVLGNNLRSAVLHDYHCTPEGKLANQVSQQMADELFREGLAVDQERWGKARVMYRAVTSFQRVKYLFSKDKYDSIPEAE